MCSWLLSSLLDSQTKLSNKGNANKHHEVLHIVDAKVRLITRSRGCDPIGQVTNM